MKLYKDSNNNVFAYEENGSQDHLIGDKVKITEEEASNIHNQNIQNELNKLTYAEKRASEYPAIGDQLDALFHAGVFPADMAAQIQAIKDKYPKE
jgi:hypothetical protein